MELLAPPKETKRVSRREIKIVFKAAFAVIFFVLGFDFSNSTFFNEFPILGLPYVAQVFIPLFSALFGYLVVPILIIRAIRWVEYTITVTVRDIIYDFWEQQSKKIEENKNEASLDLVQKSGLNSNVVEFGPFKGYISHMKGVHKQKLGELCQ